MNKNILLVIAGVVIIGLGLFMFLGQGEKSEEKATASTEQTVEDDHTHEEGEAHDESESSNDAEKITISYTDDGFEPADKTITVGQTIAFVNNSSTSMWVASDDHPTHTEHPEFDSKQGVGPGETYEFTFDEVGEWTYHDHLNSSAGGVITITAAE